MLIALCYILIVPILLTTAGIVFWLSEPGFFLDGQPTGNTYATLAVLLAVALVVAIKKFGKKSATSIVAGAGVSIGVAIALLVALVALVIWIFASAVSNGWCNPHC